MNNEPIVSRKLINKNNTNKRIYRKILEKNRKCEIIYFNQNILITLNINGLNISKDEKF